MKLLDALKTEMDRKKPHIPQTRLVHFAFAEGQCAFLSTLELEELVPLLENWCRERRIEMGRVH